MKNLRGIYVEWEDSHSFDPWEPLESFKDEHKNIKTVGLLLRESKSWLTIMLNYDPENEHASCVIQIPQSAVRRRQWLKIP